jgi:protein-disulfide isomerase
MQLRLSLSTAALALATLAPAAAPFAVAQGTAAPAQPAAPRNDPSAPIASLPMPGPGNPADIFPKPDPKNFTADTPTAATVNEFLRQSWGYDGLRIWQVQAIMKTAVPGVSKVVVLVTQKAEKPQIASLQFFTMPDGKHLIADDVLPFGATPFAENRKIVQDRASGPSQGAASKDLMLVEFADFQCPHCKEAQATIEKLKAQFPKARFVYQNFPLAQIHTEAYKASAYSECVAKQGGNEAFFKFVAAAYDAQARLTPEGSDQALSDAVTKAGLDPAKIATCSTSAEAKAAVDASLKLGQDIGVNQTPMLIVNGRSLPLGSIPYEQLVLLINYQAQLDGVQAAAGK